MFNFRLYIRIWIQVLAIVLLSCLGIAGIFSGKVIILGGVALVIAFVLTWILIASLNVSNRRIQLFLDVVREKESSLFFPEDEGSEEQRNLHKAFNRINRLLAEMKRENRTQELFLQALLQHIPGGIIAWKEDGEIQIINEAALSQLGIPAFKHISRIEAYAPGFTQKVEEAMYKGGTAMLNLEQGGVVRYLSLSARKVTLEEENIYILSLHDIGRELSRKEYESWDKLTHVLTHEIMNSIAPIVSLSGTILGYYQTRGAMKNPEDINENTIRKTVRGIKTIREQGESLLRFTDSYRRFSRLKLPEYKKFSANDLIGKITFLFRSETEKLNIQLTVNLSPENVYINGDEELISQIMINLLKNAIDSVKGQDNKEISAAVSVSDKDMNLLSISDNGPGILPEIGEDIFVPFFSTKKSGSGIGLSLSRQIDRMHGGDLTYTSIAFQRTTFTLTIP